ncbi:hypothetical protein ACU686_28085 [Yinghuangia aomiensis]
MRANRVAWILGTQLAALGGILIAPTVTLDAAQLALLIVRRLHRGRLRTAAQPALHVPRRDRRRMHGELPGGLLAAEPVPARTPFGRTSPAALPGAAGVPARAPARESDPAGRSAAPARCAAPRDSGRRRCRSPSSWPPSSTRPT